MCAVNGWFIQSRLQILELKIFRKIKFHVIKKFVVTGELKFSDMAHVGRRVMSWIRPHVRVFSSVQFSSFWLDQVLRSLEEIVAFVATMYIRRCERQLLEKCWSVWESRTMFKVDMPWLRKKSGTIMGHLPRWLSRVCSFLRRGGTTSCTVVTWGRRYSVDLYVALNFCVPVLVLLCTKAHVLFLYRKLSLF